MTVFPLHISIFHSLFAPPHFQNGLPSFVGHKYYFQLVLIAAISLSLISPRYKKIFMLSTGEIRKVLVAATLSQSPRVLVLDKPFDGLDAPSRYAGKIGRFLIWLSFKRLTF